MVIVWQRSEIQTHRYTSEYRNLYRLRSNWGFSNPFHYDLGECVYKISGLYRFLFSQGVRKHTHTHKYRVFSLTLYAHFHSLLKHYLCHVNLLYNLITRSYRTVIFQISALYIKSVNFWPWSKLELYFVHIWAIYRKMYTKN